jgi:hypothetical protein
MSVFLDIVFELHFFSAKLFFGGIFGAKYAYSTSSAMGKPFKTSIYEFSSVLIKCIVTIRARDVVDLGRSVAQAFTFAPEIPACP